MIFICWAVHSILILLSVAFFTLFERKVIALFHNRLGPNKVSFIGLVQPLLDAFKLLTKQFIVPLQANTFTYLASPQVALLISIFIWITIPRLYFILSINYSFVIFFCLGSVMVLSNLLRGWSSNSKYSLIGRLRSVAQSISYEAVFSTLIVLFMFLVISFSIRRFVTQSSVLYLLLLPLWVICILAEGHRPPFDFAESESELVSGYNTEYRGSLFAFTFLSEYGVLLYSCLLISFMFFSCLVPMSVFSIVFISILIAFLFTWIKITFCRYRYDMLMMASWKVLLPFTLSIFMLSLFLIV